MRNTILVALMVFGFPVQAEVFLGEETIKDEDPVQDEPSESPKVRGKKSAAAAKESDFGFSGSIGASAGVFSAAGVLTYGLNPYMAWGLSYDYTRLEDSERFGEEHGPDLAFMLRGPNPTMVTPVVGAGPGYKYWSRSFQKTIFDENQSPIVKYFAGVNIALSRNFGVGIFRQKTEFLRNVPIRYSDRKTKEDRARVDNSIGFYAAF